MAGEPYVEDIIVQFEDDTKDFEVKMYPEGDYGKITERVEAIEDTLPTKADSSDVEALEQTVAGKADASDVEALEQELATKADAKETEDEITGLKEDLKSALDITSVDNANFTVGRAGKYVNSEGGISSYNAYNISTPIAVSKGDAISIHYTANSSIAVVSYCDENGGIDSVVETGKGIDKDYSFISSVDGYICVSYDNAKSAYYSLVHYGFASDTNTHLSELDSSVLNLENSVSNIAADQLTFIDNTISNNLFNPATLIVGSVMGNDGVPVDLSYCSHTEYIAVAPNDVVRCTPYYLNNETSVTLYDSSKNYVQNTRWIQTVSDGVLSFTVPSGIAYMVLNVYNKHIPDIVVVKNTTYDADLAGHYGQSIKLKNCRYESVLFGKKIAYNGDSICNSRITSDNGSNGGAYAHKIALATGSSYENRAAPGGILASAAPDGQTSNRYVVSDVTNMADDADLVCFEGGINDYWKNVPLGDYSESDYSSTLDTTTICGALESIFRQATAKWVGKPIVFVITHKIKNTVYVQNTAGYTWTDVHEKMVGICKKYAIPYYDAFENSGLNAYNDVQNINFLTSNERGIPDGCHPNSDGYDKYYVPQLIALFESVMPKS